MNLHDNMKELVSLFESDGIVNQTDIMTDLGPEKSTYLRVDTPYIAYKIARNYVDRGVSAHNKFVYVPDNKTLFDIITLLDRNGYRHKQVYADDTISGNVIGDVTEDVNDHLRATDEKTFKNLSREEQIGLMNTLNPKGHKDKFKYGGGVRDNMERWYDEVESDGRSDQTHEWGFKDYWNAAKSGYDAIRAYEPEQKEKQSDGWDDIPGSSMIGLRGRNTNTGNTNKSQRNAVSTTQYDDSSAYSFGDKSYDQLSAAEKAEIAKSFK